MNHIGTIRGNTIVLSAIAIMVALVMYFLFFKALWNVKVPEKTPDTITLIILGIGLVIVHEGIHGAVALLFVGRRKISFGIKWLVVVCRVQGLMTRNQYITVALAPAFVLAMCGAFFYHVADDSNMKFLSALLCIGGGSSGGGDFWFVAKSLTYSSSCFMVDNGIEIEVYTDSQV